MTQTLGAVETARQIVDGMINLITTLSEYLPLSPLATFIGITCASFQITLSLALSKKAGLVPGEEGADEFRGAFLALYSTSQFASCFATISTNYFCGTFSILQNLRVRTSEGPWSEMPLYTAHQIVATTLMIVFAYFGFAGWFFGSETGMDSANDRIFGANADHTYDLLLAIGSGALLLWDIPTGFASPPLRDLVMWLHHIGMFLVASTMAGTYCEGNQTIGYYYVPFFFGVIELSSVFLSIMDAFHPKYKHYHNWLNSMKDSRRKKILHNCNEFCRVAFAITFLIFRGVYFPYVTFRGVIPDIREAYQSPPDTVPAHQCPLWTGQFLIAAVSLFALLQAYWGLLVAKMVVKAIRGSGSSGKKDKKEN